MFSLCRFQWFNLFLQNENLEKELSKKEIELELHKTQFQVKREYRSDACWTKIDTLAGDSVKAGKYVLYQRDHKVLEHCSLSVLTRSGPTVQSEEWSRSGAQRRPSGCED